MVVSAPATDYQEPTPFPYGMTMSSTQLLTRELNSPYAQPLFLTGAGISVASGIAPFRGSDPDAVWNKDVLEMGTFRYFRSNPADQWRWYLERFEACLTAEPNPGHDAIAGIESTLEASGRGCSVITQNVDGLHAKAGTKRLFEVHGSSRKMRCARNWCEFGSPNGTLPWDSTLFEAFRKSHKLEDLPRCPACLALLRPHVLWFDETYDSHKDYQHNAALEALHAASCVVFVGTSFSVGITEAAFWIRDTMGIPGFIVDPHLKQKVYADCHVIQEPSEVFLPTLCAALR